MLRGAQVGLRPWQEADAPTLAAAWADPLIKAHLPVPKDADEQAARRWIKQRQEAWKSATSADLAVVDLKSEVVIGEVGLSSFDKQRQAALIGWWIAKEWRGQGKAKEAVDLVTTWALGQQKVPFLPPLPPLRTLLAQIQESNKPSIALAKKTGFRQLATTHPNQPKQDLLVFAKTRPQTGKSPGPAPTVQAGGWPVAGLRNNLQRSEAVPETATGQAPSAG